MPEVLDLVLLDEGTANFASFDTSPFVAVFGKPNADGVFLSTGTGTVEGIEDVAVEFRGQLINGRLSGTYTMGTDGKLSNEQPVKYDLIGRLLQSSTPSPALAGGN
jgi:hypothetical protein